MTEQETIDAVTETLAPTFAVGSRVTVNWETTKFVRAQITKIERGWYFIQSLDNPRWTGACSKPQLRHLT